MNPTICFEHRRSVKKAGRLELCFYLTSFSLLFGLVAYLVATRGGPSEIFFAKVVVGVTVFILPLLAWNLRHLRGSGEWHIRITPDTVIWQAPEHLGQVSFILPVHDISAIVHESSRSNENDHGYFLQMSTGVTHPLNLEFSGLPIQRFCRALERTGVKYEECFRN